MPARTMASGYPVPVCRKTFASKDLKNIENPLLAWRWANRFRTIVQHLHYSAVFSCVWNSELAREQNRRLVNLILRINCVLIGLSLSSAMLYAEYRRRPADTMIGLSAQTMR
jgi:hypothetical protein